MTDTQLKKRRMLVQIGIVVTYLIMYIIDTVAHSYGMSVWWGSGSNIGYILKYNFCILTAVVIFCILPFEHWVNYCKVDYLRRSFFGGKIKKDYQFQIEYSILYGIVAILCCFYSMNVYRGFYWVYTVDVMSWILCILCLIGIIISFSTIEKDIPLLMYSQGFILANGIITYLVLDLFTYSAIMTVSLELFFYILFFKNRREHRFLYCGLAILANVWELLGAITFFGKWEKVDGFLEYRRHLETLGYEPYVLRNHTLQLPINKDTISVLFRHAFSEMYTFLGWEAVTGFLLAFGLMGVCVFASKKIISKRRFELILGIYMFAIIYVLYHLLADFGFVPTCYTNGSLVIPRIQWLYVAVMIRMLIVCETKELTWYEEKLTQDKSDSWLSFLGMSDEDYLEAEFEYVDELYDIQKRNNDFLASQIRLLNNRIRRLEERVESLENMKKEETTDKEVEDIKVEDAQVDSDEKDADVESIQTDSTEKKFDVDSDKSGASDTAE